MSTEAMAEIPPANAHIDSAGPMTQVLLVRHGQVANPQGVYYGRLPGFSLSETGRAQAAAAGELLRTRNVAVVYHSPMLRARETAEIVGHTLGNSTRVIESRFLNEIHSLYDGRLAEEMNKLDWDFYQNVPVGYEQPHDVVARVISFFEFVCRTHPGKSVVGVSHADPIAFAIAWASERPVTPAQRKSLQVCGVPAGYPENASISTFSFPDSVVEPGMGVDYWSP